ncbi:MAG: tRNA lysidine(34) synthetase TilS [Marmoricola sp.]
MSGPAPAVAATRLAVRAALPRSGTVLVACSGGADSLALLAACVFETRRTEVRVVGAVVDHGLQDGSAAHTDAVVAQMAGLGVEETASIRVTVDPGPAGIEAGAREARYAALGQLAAHVRAGTVLLGHTLDDQAETVLLGLARGSGARSLQGMRRTWVEDGVAFARPLLDLTRAHTEAACAAENITWWADPHNSDPRFLRSRVRHDVLPVLERELGPGVAAALARTADALREDVAALDDLAAEHAVALHRPEGWDAAGIAALPDALALRVVRVAALAAGAPASDLGREHVLAVRRLLEAPGREIQLPGHLSARCDGTLLRFEGRAPTGG